MSETAVKVSDDNYGGECCRRHLASRLQMGIRHVLRLLRILTNLVYSVTQKCIEQHQLSTMKHNGYCFVPFNGQMTSDTEEMSSLSDVTARDCSSHVPRELFGWSVAPRLHRTAYMRPMQLGFKEEYV
ncbi:hypothetical protein Bca101_059832 [Brassica carinata]